MQIDDCIPKPAAKILTLEEAREVVESTIAPLTGYEQLVLRNCLGRVLFDDVRAPIDIPQEAQSSMDGYAFNSRELAPGSTSRFRVAGTSWAGRPYMASVSKGECVRIFTGAAMPSGTDSVVMQENVHRSDDLVEIPAGIRSQENIRTPGDEIERGQGVLEKGKRLSPADIGILASLGIHEIRVRRMPRVAFFSTGDELVSLDTPLEAGRIYDSNRYLLYGLLKALGIEALDFGIVPDNRDEVLDALVETSAVSDVVITSGGVSVGDADLVRNAVASTGHIAFWKIAMKPGKPLAFGQFGAAQFFGLPGNPVSVFVTFYQIVRPALLRMMGAKPGKALRMQAVCLKKIVKTPGRQEFQRGNLFIDESGTIRVVPSEKQQSHQLSAMARCNCFIVLPAECGGIEAGKPVEVEWIDPAFHFN
ncbi:MAG: molybdopterin molybdotransferase MoeA [Methylococcales bacterium]